MLNLDPSTIANSLVIMCVGAWILWVSKGILKNQKDINACFRKMGVIKKKGIVVRFLCFIWKSLTKPKES